jgi:Mg-chelatase subunit ChlD
MVKLNALAFSVTQARNTQDVANLCQRILHMLEEEAQPPELPPDDNAGDGASDGMSGDASPENGNNGPGKDSDQGNDPAASDDGSGQLTNAAAEGNQPALDDTGAECANASVADVSDQIPNPSGVPGTGEGDAGTESVLQQILAASAEDLAFPLIDRGQHLQSLLDKTSRATRKPLVIAEPDPVPRGQANGPVLTKARATTVALRRRLAVLVQASREEARWRSPRGHRLSGRDLYRLTCREAGIFRRQDRHEAPNTAVLILLDRSGSMGNKMQVANQATLATALALQEIEGCTVAVGAFPGSRDDRVIPLLGFGEQARHVAGRFLIHADGGTPLTPALWWAGYSLLLQPEPRRLLLVITDGQPQNRETAQDAIARCRASGIEVMGLGINAQDTVERLFGPQEATNIITINQLAPRLFHLLEQRLIQHAA